MEFPLRQGQGRRTPEPEDPQREALGPVPGGGARAAPGHVMISVPAETGRR